ncbi:acyl-CoA carboxylase subunit beta [Faecalispora anaeroviscerum]|uniref:acyl-CoA carboxylase subunit beta n=1 Tax=Faecalispora anaeroviscerum TaxID=2991836 RepID=UPI0024B89994|nr:carboxyl transferase domain-containing protein [Faecalispora anaeroviscerum]
MAEHGYSMPSYFKNMPIIGSANPQVSAENETEFRKVEKEIADKVTEMRESGRSDESLHQSGQMTATDRIEALVDPGSFLPLNSLYDPESNSTGSTGIIKGLGKIRGKWAMIIASDNKKLAGAWVAGQADNLLRGSDTAKCLNVPLVYVLNCSGVKLDEQEKVYANRRGGGTPFFRNADLQQNGIPVIVGIYGTNPAGGGYHSISPTILIAHEKANMAVGGAGIVGGMNPKGYVDEEAAQALIEATKKQVNDPPGNVAIHYGETGFFREAYTEEMGVLEAIQKYMDDIPAYNPEFFRVDCPQEPNFEPSELYSILTMNTKRPYNVENILSRVFDGSQFDEYKKGYGPEIITGIAKVNGLLVGVIANYQGILMNYPEYKENSVGVGGKLYRQGLIKMNEFVTLCGRDRLPIVWFQDTTGIDVGNDAEKAELLGLGQSLIYSIQSAKVPQIEITLRKSTAAAHYVMGGPQGNDTNAFTLGTAASEVNVMHGETAAAAMYSRRLVKDAKAGKDLKPTIDKMNEMIEEYRIKSGPLFCAQHGFLDEIIELTKIRNYVVAFAESAYQNPRSFCAFHQMLLPRAIRDYNNVFLKSVEK